jgi:DNA repair exonuclease SbcCD ATPase subunit
MHKLLHVSKDEKEHFTGMHVVLTAHDRTILGVVGHTKELGSAMGEMAEAVGKVTGNDKLGAEVKEKLAKAMEIVTVAQTTLTVAQEAATIAAIAFDAALWPVILVVAAVVAGVAVAASVLKALGFSFSAAGEKVREFLSFFGLVDSKKVHEAKEETERLGKEIEKNTEKQKNAVDELEAQDAAVKDIIAAKKKQLETDQALLIEQRAQAVIAGDTAKIAEIDKKLEEDKIGLIKLQTEAKKEQAKEDDEAKNKKIEDAKAAKDAYAQKLSDAKSLADAQLAATIAGSKAELAAKVNDLNAAAAVELNNARGNADMIKAIKTKLNNDIAAVNDEFNKQKEEKDRTAVQEKLNLEKKNTEVLLVLYKDDAAKTLQLSLQLAEQEKNIALTNANLTVNEKLLIEKQYNDKVKALNGA